MPYPLRDPYYNPYGPVARFALQGIQPPALQYIGPSDQLQLTVLAPNVNSSFTLGLRILDLRGEIQPLAYVIAVPATGAVPFTQVFNLGECFILSAVIDQANVRFGQCFCKLLLQRGNPNAGASVGATLISGYATTSDTLSFPTTPAQSSLQPHGTALVYHTGPLPMGTMAVITVPAATRWRLMTASANADPGTVPNSSFYLFIANDAGLQVCVPIYPDARSPTGAPPTNYAWGVGNDGAVWPDTLWLQSGWTITFFFEPLFPHNFTVNDFTVTVEEMVEV